MINIKKERTRICHASRWPTKQVHMATEPGLPPKWSEEKWCELMAIRNHKSTATLVPKRKQLCQFSRSDFAIKSQVFGRWEMGFTTLAGTIHNWDPSIHNSVHNFWQANHTKWRRLRHSHGLILPPSCTSAATSCSVACPVGFSGNVFLCFSPYRLELIEKNSLKNWQCTTMDDTTMDLTKESRHAQTAWRQMTGQSVKHKVVVDYSKLLRLRRTLTSSKQSFVQSSSIWALLRSPVKLLVCLRRFENVYEESR